MSALRLAWLATHPIQYQAPLFRAISRCPDINLKVLFFSDFSTRGFVDRDFTRAIRWDTPLLDGYQYEFLPGSDAVIQRIQTFAPKISGLRARLTRRDFDAVVIQGWQHYGMLHGAWLGRSAGLRVLIRCEATDHVKSSKGIKRLLREAVVRLLLSKVDRCLAIGTHNRNFYLGRGVSRDKIDFMPYSVDNDHFRAKADAADTSGLRAELGLADDRPVLLFSGKLMPRKHPDILLKAYQGLPEPRPYLIYVGDGEMRTELERAASSRGLKDVRFAGFRNQSELPAFYELADIFVLPSVDETWGLVVNEAMNAGCAIIATDRVGCAVDLVRSGENGFVIPTQDARSLTDAVQECLAQGRYHLMGKRSQAIIGSWGIPQSVAGLRVALGLARAPQERTH